MSLFHTPRLLSNKENSLSASCLPTFISKPTLSGLGRSPRKKGNVHGSKPYARTASVHKPTTTIRSKAGKGGRTIPPPLDLSQAQRLQPQAVLARSEVRIPLSLPKVEIPLVPHLDAFFDPEVPFEYVRARLLPRLSAFGIVSAQFRPYPTLSLPPTEGHRPSIAFAVPAILDGRDPNHHLAAKLQGREPDLCLAISKKGDTTMKTPASLVPVNQLVFASQCYHWPRIISEGMADVSTPTTIDRSPSPELKSIKEEEEEEPPVTLKEETDDQSFESDLSASTITLSSPATPTHLPLPVLHLLIQQLPLPSPETYSYLHNLLHFTHSPPPSTFSPLQNLLGMDVAHLHTLSNQELMKKLAVIQGVWKNCCALGVGDGKIWQGMRDAWGAVVGIVAERGKKAGGMGVGGMDMDK